jgi:molecular chaperone DnaK
MSRNAEGCFTPSLQNIESPAPGIMSRATVSKPSQTGVPAIDSKVPQPEQGTSNSSPASRKVVHCDLTLTREEFETQTRHLVERCFTPLATAMKDAKLEIADIDDVVLVGGSSRIPSVQAMVSSFFDREVNLLANPDELVAIGASVQAGVLGGETRAVVLIDVTSLTVGVEVYGGWLAPIIKRNTKLPVTSSKIFSPAHKQQNAIEVHVLQGESNKSSECISLGKFSLELEEHPNARGEGPYQENRAIDIQFSIDTNGLLVVTAVDKTTNLQASLEFSNPAGSLDEATLERLIRTAEEQETERAGQEDDINVQAKSNALCARIDDLLRNIIPCPGDSQYSADPDSLSAKLTATQKILKQYTTDLYQAYLDLDYDSMRRISSNPDIGTQISRFEQLLAELRSA